MGLKMRKTQSNKKTAHSAHSKFAHNTARAYKPSPIGFMRKLSNLARQTHGVTAIEFGFVAPVFFMLVFFAFEYSYYSFKSQMLRNVLLETNRYIQKGHLKDDGNTEAALREYVCSQAEPLLKCADIDIDVQPFERISQVTFPAITYNSDGRASNFSINLTSSHPIRATRLSMAHKFTANFMNEQVANSDGYVSILSESIAIIETHLFATPSQEPPQEPPPPPCPALYVILGWC